VSGAIEIALVDPEHFRPDETAGGPGIEVAPCDANGLDDARIRRFGLVPH